MIVRNGRPSRRIGSFCKKCNEFKAVVVLRVKDAYCRKCFLYAVTHKFRAALGKSKLMKPGDKVMIAFSGSQSSVALSHLVNAGLELTSHKRLLFERCALYIDETAVLGVHLEERKAIFSRCAKVLANFEVKSYWAPLSNSLATWSDNVHSLCANMELQDSYDPNGTNDKALLELFNNLQSSTAKEDLLQKLRRRLLLRVAAAMGCDMVFLAETGSRLAINILTSISLGRGAQLPNDVGFCVPSDSRVKLLRPMRDFSNKEVVFYNIFNKLESAHVPSFVTMMPPDSSIQRLTEKFVTDLQAEFPATTSTIFRTGDKLSVKPPQYDSEDSVCLLCQAALDTEVVESSSLMATAFSRIVSKQGPQTIAESMELPVLCDSVKTCCEISDLGAQCCGDIVNCQCHIATAVRKEDVSCNLCYSCQLILEDMDSLQHIPIDIISASRQRNHCKQMREQIKDFLL